MAQYIALQDFQWGKTLFYKGEVVQVTEQDDELSLATAESDENRSQIIGTRSVETMVFLNKIALKP